MSKTPPPSTSSQTDDPVFRSPPSGDLSKMSTFDLAINFVINPKTCSSEVVDIIKNRLNVNDRYITSWSQGWRFYTWSHYKNMKNSKPYNKPIQVMYCVCLCYHITHCR